MQLADTSFEKTGNQFFKNKLNFSFFGENLNSNFIKILADYMHTPALYRPHMTAIGLHHAAYKAALQSQNMPRNASITLHHMFRANGQQAYRKQKPLICSGLRPDSCTTARASKLLMAKFAKFLQKMKNSTGLRRSGGKVCSGECR